jgi:hypothetical protein
VVLESKVGQGAKDVKLVKLKGLKGGSFQILFEKLIFGRAGTKWSLSWEGENRELKKSILIGCKQREGRLINGGSVKEEGR